MYNTDMANFMRWIYRVETHGLNARIGILAALTSAISLLLSFHWGNHYTLIIVCWTAFILAFAETPAKPKLSTKLVLGTGVCCALFFFLGILLHPWLIARTALMLVFAFIAYYVRRFGEEYILFPIVSVITFIVSSSFFTGDLITAVLAGAGSILAMVVYLCLSKLVVPVSIHEAVSVIRDTLRGHMLVFAEALIKSVTNKFALKTARNELYQIRDLARSNLRYTNLEGLDVSQQFLGLKLARRLYEAWHNAFKENNPLLQDARLIKLLRHIINRKDASQRFHDLALLKQLEDDYILQRQDDCTHLINSCNVLFTLKQVIEWI